MPNIHDAVPHTNILVPLHVMQEQQSLGRDVLNTDQTHSFRHTSKNAYVQESVREQGKETDGRQRRVAVQAMEFPVRVCRLIQGTSHYIRTEQA